MKPGVGDLVEFAIGDARFEGYVIGYPVGASDEVVVAKPEWLGDAIKIANCRVIAAGFYEISYRLQDRYRLMYPTRLQGLFVEDYGRVVIY
jgi:hypothetical protein